MSDSMQMAACGQSKHALVALMKPTTKNAPWKRANRVPVVKAPCSLLPDAMPETRENAAPEPNADIILHRDMQQSGLG